ncbi:hypothetical protein CB0940_02525 [Cercospora beticola]|uniref:Uncharacterized protein n=1 Tax=Cercospora beticola TaxID=122368 RepID=A0A2G5I3N7_CERBT|nr:hypothetical protein CB0940_02525 [Cercospora beticola]PIA99112.1 hypothetical protein CB0940_02525 [Cercospora beticola]WPA99665.1 hypothetical protein RHO25_004283 [Cercospora beticola]
MSVRTATFNPSSLAKATPPHLRKKGADGSTNIGAPHPVPLFSFDDYREETASFQETPGSNSTGVQLPPSSPPSTAEFVDMDDGFEPKFEAPPGGFAAASKSVSVPLAASIHAPPSIKMEQDVEIPAPTAARSFAQYAAPLKPSQGNDAAPIKQYEPEDLIHIGKQCSNRLPPASAVQAMFLYEMQRQSESERLFHAHMFRLARSEEDIVAQAGRFNAIEARIAKLDQQVANSNNELRITASEGRLVQQQQKIAECLDRLANVEGKSATMTGQLDTLKQDQVEAAAATANAIKEATQTAATATSANGAQQGNGPSTEAFDIMKQEIDVLFKDRDGIITKLADVNSRIDSLMSAVQQLAAGSNTSITPQLTAASPVTQRLPARTNHGDLVDLSVPKGKPAVGLNGSVRADVKSFVPGKPWSG